MESRAGSLRDRAGPERSHADADRGAVRCYPQGVAVGTSVHNSSTSNRVHLDLWTCRLRAVRVVHRAVHNAVATACAASRLKMPC